jgi:uncharacterized protein involved in outer membrane biogenesis
MSKWVKIFGGLAVLLVAVVVAGVAILSTLDFNQYKGLIAEQAKKATGRDLVISGDLNLEISLNPAIAVDGVSFANAAWGSQPEMVKVDRFAAEVSLIPLLSGQVVVNRLLVEGVDLLVEINKDGMGNWEFGGAKPADAAPAESGSSDVALPSVDQVVMRDIRVTYKDGVNGEEYRVALDELTAAAGTVDTPVEIALKGSLNEKPFSVGGTLGSVAQMASSGEIYPIDIKAQALGADTAYKGSLGTPAGNISVNGDVTLSILSIAATLADVADLVPGFTAPALGADVLQLNLKLVFDGKVGKLNGLGLSLGKTDLAGSIEANIGGAIPTLNAALTSNLIDVDELFPPQEESAAPAEPAPTPSDGRVFPNDPLPLDGLKAANVDLTFNGKKVIVQRNEIDDIAVKMTLKGGNLNVDPLAATVVGTKISGRVALDGSKATPTLVTKLSAAGLNYGDLLKQRGLTNIAEGELDADIDISGAGGSVRALMAGLNGEVVVKTENGKINSNALNIVSSDVMSVLPGFNSKDDKTLKCGVVNLKINQGIAGVHSMVFETGGLSAIGIGNIDLRDEKLALVIDSRAKNASLASAAVVPVTISGTLLKPEWELSKAALAGNAASTVTKGAAAIATGGLSLLAESVLTRAADAVDKTDYCTPALAGKKVVPGELSDASSGSNASSSGGSAQPSEQKSGVEGAADGISKGLKSLFGN